MSDHLYICNTRDRYVLIIYTLLAIHLLFSIIIIVRISQQNKTLHSCDRIELTVDTDNGFFKLLHLQQSEKVYCTSSRL